MRDDKEHCWDGGADYLNAPEGKADRERLRPWVAVLAGASLAVLVFAAKESYGAPKAQSPAECNLIADMVLVAVALERNEIAKKEAVMETIYAAPLASESADKWKTFISLALRFAKKKEIAGLEPHQIFSGIQQGCHESQGNVDKILGGDSV